MSTSTMSVDYLYRLHYSRSMKKYKLSSQNEENERTINITKKGHCACSHHGPINILTCITTSNTRMHSGYIGLGCLGCVYFHRQAKTSSETGDLPATEASGVLESSVGPPNEIMQQCSCLCELYKHVRNAIVE
jgi:hypothetical protein